MPDLGFYKRLHGKLAQSALAKKKSGPAPEPKPHYLCADCGKRYDDRAVYRLHCELKHDQVVL